MFIIKRTEEVESREERNARSKQRCKLGLWYLANELCICVMYKRKVFSFWLNQLVLMWSLLNIYGFLLLIFGIITRLYHFRFTIIVVLLLASVFLKRIASSILYMSCKDLCNIKVYYPCCIYRWYTRAMHVLIYVFVLAKFLSQIFARSFSLRESLLIEKSEGGAIPNWPCINSIYFHCATLFP